MLLIEIRAAMHVESSGGEQVAEIHWVPREQMKMLVLWIPPAAIRMRLRVSEAGMLKWHLNEDRASTFHLGA